MSHPPPAIDTVGVLAQLAPVVLLGVIYVRRALTLSAEGRPAPRWRQLSFCAGLVAIAATILALDHDAKSSLYWHTVQQLLIGEVASLLIVLGLTGPLIAPLLRIDLFARLRVITNPLIAFPLWAANLYLWHLPALYESALHNSGMQALQHLCLLAFGINMWMCLFGPLPTPQWFGDFAKLGYIVVVRLTGAVLANIFLWSSTVFYPYYIHPDLVRHMSPLVDQNIAGAIMLGVNSALTVGLFCWLFVHTLRESSEREELPQVASADGWALGDERAGRRITSGRAPRRPGRFQPSPETLTAQQQPPG
jgi:cytochrome c oxidase assembly factor CtaG